MVEEPLPITKDFTYHVSLSVSIPHAWGEFIRGVALNHYDGSCRDSAVAGVVNGLCNTASDGEFPSHVSLDWRDFDFLAKIMEQGHYHTPSLELVKRAAAINAWISRCKTGLIGRKQALARWDAEQVFDVQVSSPSP